eukprot:PhF_6_TR462/c0_g1_i1/m.187
MLAKAEATASAFINDNHYFMIFVSYTVIVTILSTGSMMMFEDVQFVDAWFLSISCFSCTGLSIVDFTVWGYPALIVMLLTIELGSMVILSAGPSYIRWLTLRSRLMYLKPGSKYHKSLVHRINIDLVIIWMCWLYWILAHLWSFCMIIAVKPFWWSVYHTVTGYNNAGFALDPANFATEEMANNAYLLVIFIFLMPQGNTLYPVYQRLLTTFVKRIMLSTWITRDDKPQYILMGLSRKEFAVAIVELLKNPRKYYTHLFTNKETLHLFVMWLFLTGVDYAMFIPEYGQGRFPGNKCEWIAALFQTVSTRTTGFAVMDLTGVRLGHLTYWIIAMYLSSYPFIITERTSRVDGGQDDETHDHEAPLPEEGGSVFRIQEDMSRFFETIKEGATIVEKEQVQEIQEAASETIARELGWLYLVFIWICILENPPLNGDNITGTSVHTRLLFELASAYGTVGLTLPGPAQPALAFTASFTYEFSKVMMLCVMYCGKFRGLPQNVDVGENEIGPWKQGFVLPPEKKAEEAQEVTQNVEELANVSTVVPPKDDSLRMDYYM